VASVDLAEFKRQRLRVAVRPGPSLFTLAADVVGAGRGSPAEWIAAARAELEPSDLEVLRPIGGRWGSFTPACVATFGSSEDAEIDSELERIATLPEDDLLADIAFACGSPAPAPWDVVEREPRRWLVLYARALGRVWRGIRQPWRAASGLFEREAERVATATDRGTLRELVQGLHHDAEVRDGVWLLASDETMELGLPAGGMPITPVLAGPGSARASFSDDGFLDALTYPLPGLSRVLDGELLPPAAALESLLGDQRTTILRHLDRPQSAGRLARAMFTTPGAVTHHMKALESAGLIVRERSGRRVFVHRTERGTALLGLYEAD
jgi:DNA-binding transcriptional ArsR family regulator